jgi:hypoxanthine phosphoribosyltransferase
MRETCTGSSPGATGLGRPRFAHRSERRLARILDFYRLRWEYEPHTFPLRWSDDGRPVESFTPDFWLPDVATYLELTTSRRAMKRRKDRRVLRFQQLHPDKRIRVLYRSDLEALTTKYTST